MQIEHDIMEMLFCGALAQPGQVVFTTDTLWVVPAGVFAISALCIQRGTVAGETWTAVPGARISRAGVDLVRAKNGDRLGAGGGDGGFSGARMHDTTGDPGGGSTIWLGAGGGGGAGGYSGSGGAGGDWVDSAYGGSSSDWVGKNGAGGGGGGGICGSTDYAAGGGGGVGLLGTGSSGLGGTAFPSSAGGGSSGGAGASTPYGNTYALGQNASGIGGTYGGAAGDFRGGVYPKRGRGGANAWDNGIAVYPGETLQIYVQGNGGVRVLWGGDRFYPNNAGNL